jgi:hypothetical protein
MRQPILRCVITLTLGCLAYQNTYALSFFGSSPNPTTNTATPSRVMSGDEFSNRVNALNQQTQSQLSEQTSAVLPKQQPSTPIAGSSSSNPSAPIPMDAPPTQIQPPPSAAVTAPPISSNTTTSFPASNNNVRAQPPVSTQQNQTYPGFGTGSTNRPNTNSSSSNTGGWNIKY